MFVCRNVRKNTGSVGWSVFFFFFGTCVWKPFFRIEKNIQISNIHAFHIFMFTHVFHVPEVLRKKKQKKKAKNKKKKKRKKKQKTNSTSAKNNGSFWRIFFFEKLKKKKSLQVFLRVGRVTANKHFLCLIMKLHCTGGIHVAMRQLSGELVLCWFQTNLPLAALPLRMPRDHCLLFQSYSSQRPRCFGFIREWHRSRVE